MRCGFDHVVLLANYNQRGRKHDHDRVQSEGLTLDFSSCLACPRGHLSRRLCGRCWTTRGQSPWTGDGQGTVSTEGARPRKTAYYLEVAGHAAVSCLAGHGGEKWCVKVQYERSSMKRGESEEYQLQYLPSTSQAKPAPLSTAANFRLTGTAVTCTPFTGISSSDA